MDTEGDATSIDVPGTPEAVGYLEEIAVEMTTLFGISLSEARGRINDQLGGLRFLTAIELNVLLHEEQDVWARTHLLRPRQLLVDAERRGAFTAPLHASSVRALSCASVEIWRQSAEFAVRV